MLMRNYTPKSSEEYHILRDYYVHSKEIDAIFFVIEDPKTGNIFKRWVYEEEVNHEPDWKKVKGNVEDFEGTIIEKADGKPKLIVEKGTITVEKGFTKKETECTTILYRFQL